MVLDAKECELSFEPITEADKKAEVERLRGLVGEFESEAQVEDEQANDVWYGIYEDATHGIFQAHDGTFITGKPIKRNPRIEAFFKKEAK